MKIPSSLVKYVPLLLSFLLVIPIILPIFRAGFFSMHDYTHAARLAELDRGLKSGHIPARWSDNFGWGYGMPLFHYYAPLFYYFAEVFYLVGLPAVICIKISIIITLVIGAIAAYLLGKEFSGKWGGLICAAAFTYAPYRAVQFYVRGALAELLATSFIPLLLLSIYKIIKSSFEKKDSGSALALFVLSVTAILLSHNVIAILIIPLMFVWTVAWILYFTLVKRTKPLAGLKLLIIGGMLTLLCSAWFVLPAFFEKDLTMVQTISGGYSYFKLHFVYLRQFVKPDFRYGGSILGPDDDISFQFGLSQIAFLLTSFLVAGFLLIRHRRERNRELFAYGLLLVCLLASVFMMTFHSTFVWERIQILQMAQFPWRILSITAVLTACIVSYVAYALGQIRLIPLRMTLGMAFVLILMFSNFRFFKPDKYVESDALFYTDAKRIQEHMSNVLKDYLPKQAMELPVHTYPAITFNTEEYKPIDYQQSNGLRSFHIDSVNGGLVRLATYDFPGWSVNIDGKKISHIYEPETGFIQFELPKGPHLVQAKLEKTKLQTISDIISLLTYIMLVVYVLFKKVTHIRKAHEAI